jgi:hypothetical protein
MTVTDDKKVHADESVNIKTGEVAPSQVLLSDDNLADIISFDDALALINKTFGGQVVQVDKEVGNGFFVVDDKNPYVGVPMIVVMVSKHASEKSENGYFYSLFAVCKDGRKIILNDGSTGIADQLDKLYAKHPEKIGIPLVVPKGLRVSNYLHPEHGKCQTFYLDTSPASA